MSLEILPGIEITGLGLYLRKAKTLIISDLHIGFEESLNKQGFLMPRFQLRKLLTELEKILTEQKPETVVINGDLKHEFGNISEQEWRDTLKTLDLIAKTAKKTYLIRGNHDTILGPIAQKRNVDIIPHLKLGEIYITHGDKIPANKDYKNSKIIIIGHEHPAVGLREHSRIELFKCFILGEIQNKKLIVMPSLNFVTEGTDILKEELLSPFLTNIRAFRIFVVADKIYPFGTVQGLLTRS